MTRVRVGGAIALAALALACSREQAPVSAPPPAPAPVAAPAPVQPAPPPDDAPLPGEDEVPAFLGGRKAAAVEQLEEIPVTQELVEPADLDTLVEAREPTLKELMRSVQVDGGGGADDSWAFIANPDAALAEAPAPAPEPVAEVALELDEEAEAVVLELDDEPEAPAPKDPCAALRAALEKRQDFLRRTASERDTYGYVESAEDSNALRMFQSMRRCEATPDDPDCKAPPLEVDVSELEVASHQVERSPSELNAEGRQPDDIPHDAVVLDLLHQLKRCERRQVAQPLLELPAARPPAKG